jgi:RNA recognition motif-containing protein
MNIYVGNLSYNATEEDLKEAFGAYGTVVSVTIVKDKFTGNSRGFGFVEMSDDEEGKKAVSELNEKEIAGRALKVNEARPRESNNGGNRRGGNGGGGNGGGRGGFGGGGRY